MAKHLDYTQERPRGATLPSPAEGAPNRLGFVDGLRGLAALMVMGRHYYVDAYPFGVPRWSDVLSLGYVGVHLFLLLSGFCVSWAYVGRSARPFSAKDFAIRRATRILPAYYVTLAIAAVALGHRAPGGLPWQIFTHVAMIHNLFPSTVLALNGGFWSLALESQLYLLFPLFLLGFRRVGMPVTLGLICAAQTAYRIFTLRYGVGDSNDTYMLQWGAAGRMLEFALGMCAAMLVARGSLGRWPSWAQRALPWMSVLLLVCGQRAKKHLGVTHPVTDMAWALGFLGLFLASSRVGTRLHRLMSWQPAVKVGTISYSIYLIHGMIIGYLVRTTMAWTGERVHPLLLAPPVLAVTILASAIYYRLVERPAIEFFRQLLVGSVARPVAAAAGE